MRRQRLEVADVIRTHGDAFMASRNGRIASNERRVLTAIASCRTAALGGHVDQCDRCGHQLISYNSCHNRHCPKCQANAGAEWFDHRQVDLLPVEYFHVVFTLPKEIAAIALQNKKIVYDILFRTATETLQQVAIQEKHLGAGIGILAVLHTWGQALEHHPHVHCIVPGGGIAPNQERWVSCRSGFFLPVRILSRLFRGKFLHHLRRTYENQQLTFHGRIQSLESAAVFLDYLEPLHRKEWVVYAKPPFGGPSQVLKYLARYTHRVAIANSRLTGMSDGKVSFLWKDYRHGCKRKVMTLTAVEFIRRFLLHVLPKSFVRIRYYGFLANRCRKEKVELIRTLLNDEAVPETTDPSLPDRASPDQHACPICYRGTMIPVLNFQPGAPVFIMGATPALDSS